MDQILLANLVQAAKEVFPHNPILQRLVVTQAIHESGFLTKRGGSQLALKYNNLFGIKAKLNQESVMLPTWEHIKGKDVQVKAPFRVFKDHADCFEGYNQLISMKRYERVRKSKTIEEAFVMIWKCGYATDPRYPGKLQSVYNSTVKKEFE
jgi:flagellum-specific peptidoglycan hydrolase FlgJ